VSSAAGFSKTGRTSTSTVHNSASRPSENNGFKIDFLKE